MLKNMNRKQTILTIAILLLTVVSAIIFLNVFVNAVYNDYNAPNSDDDILGSDFGRYWLAMGVAFLAILYFASLTILLHSGLYSLKSTPFSKAKCLHCISSAISLIVIVPYIWLYVGMLSHTVSEELLLSLPSGDTLAIILIFAFFSSLVLDVTGTRLHKRQLKSC